MQVAATIPLLPVEEQQRRARRAESGYDEIWELLEAVKDPEIPVLSIWDLGILQDVGRDGDTIQVTITPTWSGCPAMAAIEQDIVATLAGAGITARVSTRLAPAWTSQWISERGRQALREYGIAPPSPYVAPTFVARAPKRRCGGAHGLKDAEGIVDTMSKRLEGVRPVTASDSASAVEGWRHMRASSLADAGLRCPRCHSSQVRAISEFGATACKALYQCGDCREPFERFKAL